MKNSKRSNSNIPNRKTSVVIQFYVYSQYRDLKIKISLVRHGKSKCTENTSIQEEFLIVK